MAIRTTALGIIGLGGLDSIVGVGVGLISLRVTNSTGKRRNVLARGLGRNEGISSSADVFRGSDWVVAVLEQVVLDFGGRELVFGDGCGELLGQGREVGCVVGCVVGQDVDEQLLHDFG